MVVVVSVCVLHVLCAAWALECLCGCRVIVLVEVEVEYLESALSVAEAVVAPEVWIYIAWHHDGGLAAYVDIDAVVRCVGWFDAEGFHEVDRWSSPSSPAVAVLVESLWHEVALQCVL